MLRADVSECSARYPHLKRGDVPTACHNFQEDNLAQELRTTGNLDDSLNQALAGTIVRVSLTGKEELYRIVGVVHNLGQTVEVGEQQVCTLVGSETASETYQQSVRIDLSSRETMREGSPWFFNQVSRYCLRT